MNALRVAWLKRRSSEDAGMVFYSEQYARKYCRDVLAEYGITASISRCGTCWDVNACCGKLFGSLKVERLHGAVLQDRTVPPTANKKQSSRELSTLKRTTGPAIVKFSPQHQPFIEVVAQPSDTSEQSTTRNVAAESKPQMKNFKNSISLLRPLAVRLLVVTAAVGAGVWVSGKLVPTMKSSGGRMEAIVLDAQTKAGKPMWDPRDPKTAALLTDPGRVRQVENASSANR